MTPSRAQLWARLGPPTEQVGSVNEPRSERVGDLDWNEKWIYREADGSVRVLLWHRYDWVGSFRQAADGALEREVDLGLE